MTHNFKKIPKLILLLSIFMLGSKISYSQIKLNITPEDVKAFKGKKLYIIGEEVKLMTIFLEEVWKYSDKVTYVTEETFAQIKKTGTNDAYLDLKVVQDFGGAGLRVDFGTLAKKSMIKFAYYLGDYANRVDYKLLLSLALLEKVIEIAEEQEPSKEVLLEEFNKNKKQLQEKTLVFHTDVFDFKEKQIEKKYAYKGVVATKDEIYDYFEKPDGNHAVIAIITPYSTHTRKSGKIMIFNIKTYEILLFKNYGKTLVLSNLNNAITN